MEGCIVCQNSAKHMCTFCKLRFCDNHKAIHEKRKKNIHDANKFFLDLPSASLPPLESQKSKETKEFVLPENIKEEIKTNVIQLKELLKNDKEFAENLIWMSVHAGQYILPDYIASSVYKHYNDIIEQCKKEYQAWPGEINKVRDIAYTLSCLASGYNQSIFDAAKIINQDYSYNECEALGKLVKIEIGYQFNPEINYNYDLDLSVMVPELSSDLDPEFANN